MGIPEETPGSTVVLMAGAQNGVETKEHIRAR